jgi:hypothetical protein
MYDPVTKDFAEKLFAYHIGLFSTGVKVIEG